MKMKIKIILIYNINNIKYMIIVKLIIKLSLYCVRGICWLEFGWSRRESLCFSLGGLWRGVVGIGLLRLAGIYLLRIGIILLLRILYCMIKALFSLLIIATTKKNLKLELSASRTPKTKCMLLLLSKSSRKIKRKYKILSSTYPVYQKVISS